MAEDVCQCQEQHAEEVSPPPPHFLLISLRSVEGIRYGIIQEPIPMENSWLSIERLLNYLELEHFPAQARPSRESIQSTFYHNRYPHKLGLTESVVLALGLELP